MDERLSQRTFFKQLSELRSKERSLQHGDYVPIVHTNTTLAYLRSWDQSERYLAVFNWGPNDDTFKLVHTQLPKQAKVDVSTDPELKPGTTVDLQALKLGPQQAVLLKFPYMG